MLEKRVVGESCRAVLEKSVECCRQVLETRVVEKCWRRVW